MDKTVPAAGAAILNFIAIPESRGSYETISSFKERLLPKRITKMTVDELLADMQTWRKKYGTLSSAAGRYQIIYKTLLNLKQVMNLTGTEKFTPNLQDRMGMQLLRFRGYDAFMSGQMSLQQFAKNLAQEWASLPVLTGTKNYKGVNIKRGTSYYAGDGLNSHGVSADNFEKMLGSATHERAVMLLNDEKVMPYIEPDQVEDVLSEAQSLPASTNVKPADGPVVTATKIGAAVGTGAAVVGGAGEAAKTVTDWSPVIELTQGISKYGPAVAGAIVLIVVAVVIAKKVWKA